jgi:hypothetical protein
MKYDLVIPLGSRGSSWGNNNELRYCLRSFEKHFPLGDVYIVTDKLPDWLTNVVHVPQNDPFAHNKDANIILKVLAAAKQLKGKVFFWSCDDHVVLRKPIKSELVPLYNNDIANYQSNWFSGTWRNAIKNTFELLKGKGCTTLNYDTHTPQPVDADEFVELLGNFNFQNHYRFTINTLYHNQAAWKKTAHIGLLKATIEMPVNDVADNKRVMLNKLYMNYNDNGLTPELRKVLIELFPEKSSFEL